MFDGSLKPPVRPCMPVAPAVSSGGSPAASGQMVEEHDMGEPAKTLPTPISPPTIELEAHNATHIPFRTWCKWCVAGRKPNPHHRRKTDAARDVPMLVGDYCFVRDSRDDDLMSMYVGKLYPSKAVVAIPVTQNGYDEQAVHRLANLLRMCGVRRLVYTSDQEGALKALTEAAVNELNFDGDLISAVPEHSPVGESQSNGRAERTVQQVEDLVRTMKAAFEDRFNLRLSASSPVMAWLVEHAACTATRSLINSDGRTV